MQIQRTLNELDMLIYALKVRFLKGFSFILLLVFVMS